MLHLDHECAHGAGPMDLSGRSRRQLLQQRLRLLQIARVEAFGKPAVDRSEQFAIAVFCPGRARAAHAHCGAEFPGFGLLLTSDLKGALEICFGSSDVALALGSTRFIMHALP
jgi:hypothetical protein